MTSAVATTTETRLRRTAGKRARRQAELATLDGELRELVLEMFKEGYSGSAIAAAAGLSIPRVYQIRDGRR